MDFKIPMNRKTGVKFGSSKMLFQDNNKDFTQVKPEDPSTEESEMNVDGKEETNVFSFGQPCTLGQANTLFKNEASKGIFGGLSGTALQSPWRNVTWSQEAKEALMDMVRSYKPAVKSVSEARVLLLGPVGAGKSSFISSVQSVFSGRVLNRAMVGSSTSTSTGFTKKLQDFNIRHTRETAASSTGLVLCDVMGIGDGEFTGLTLHDVLCIIKGHVPEGHRFSPEEAVDSGTAGFIQKPSLKEKIHCAVFVIDASKLNSYPKGVSKAFKQLREHISNLGVHQVTLLTHVDEVCKETAQDITQVYKSRTVQQLMVKAGELLGMATSYIVPVKNYSSQLDLDEHTDILLLRAVDHILQYADLYFQDNAAENKVYS